jgi:hypothetical protein
MAASETVVKERLTDLLNVQAAGTWSAVVAATNLDRHATGIAEAAREAALDIARAIVSNPKHYHRNLFISPTPVALTYGGELPDYGSEYDTVEIEKYSGGTYEIGTPLSAQKIESYRVNPNSVYGTLSYITQGSPLSGYYNIENGKVRYTGNAARIYVPVISRTTVLTLIPDEYEGPWYYIAAGILLKEGDNLLPIAQHYAALGQSALQAIAQEGSMPPLVDYREVK